MRTREVITKAKKYLDFYGQDIEGLETAKTKEDVKVLLEEEKFTLPCVECLSSVYYLSKTILAGVGKWLRKYYLASPSGYLWDCLLLSPLIYFGGGGYDF